MTVANKSEPAILALGDIFFFLGALLVTLVVRYGEIPSENLVSLHVIPFSILFIVWVLAFFIFGLYDKQTTFFKSQLPAIITKAQIVNVIIAALFFFFIPYFEITPKTNLAIYLIVSSTFIVIWRLYLFPLLSSYRKERAVLVGSGEELEELAQEVNENDQYMMRFVDVIDAKKVGTGLSERIFKLLNDKSVAVIVVDAEHESIKNILPHLYKPIFSNTRFINFRDVYEEIFERIPLSSFDETFFRFKEPSIWYRVVKRTIDIIGGSVLLLVLLVLLPFIWILIKLEDGGSIFIEQKRIGEGNSEVSVLKIRTMTNNDQQSATWVKEHGETNKVTRIGKILRHTSIDEFPQCFAILRGDMSLVGPRSDILGLGKRLSSEIPSYDIRYNVLPGITGWAQVKQRYAKGAISPQSIDETRLRLAYDLYYIKYQSIWLDVSIALRTLSTLLSRII